MSSDLFQAAIDNDVKGAKKLLASGKVDLEATDALGQTALHLSACECARCLLRRLCDALTD